MAETTNTQKPLFLDLERAQLMEEGFAWLSNYTGPTDENEVHEIRIRGDKSEYFTEALAKLARLNNERTELLKIFTEFGK